MLSTHQDILRKLEIIERKEVEQGENILLIFDYLRQLEEAKYEEMEEKKSIPIVFRMRNGE